MRRSPRNIGFWAATPIRRATAPLRSTADIIICGAQKSGTTYLAELLASQPGFYEPPIKEIYFFNGFWHRGTSWYASHFQLRTSKALQIDASPNYMIHGAVPSRIRETNPDARVIFVLRDPVARAYSHFQHNLRSGWEDLDFPAALAAEDGRIAADLKAMEKDPNVIGIDFGLYSYRSRGLYARYLERFYDVIPRDNVLVLDSEKVFANDPTESALLEGFLGRPVTFDVEATIRTNSGSYAREASDTDQELRELFEPWDDRLVEITGRRFSWMSDGS